MEIINKLDPVQWFTLSMILGAVVATIIGMIRYRYEETLYASGIDHDVEYWFDKGVDDIAAWWIITLAGFIYPVTITLYILTKMASWLSNIGNNLANKKIKEHNIQQQLEEDKRQALIDLENKGIEIELDDDQLSKKY